MRRGQRVQDALFAVHALANHLSFARLAISVSRRVSARAVDRNRIKRLVRETFRHEQNSLRGLDLVVTAMPASRQATPENLRTMLRTHWMILHKRCALSS
jgi:ribonuclease P protein component